MLNFIKTSTISEFKSDNNLTSVFPKIHSSGKTSFETSNEAIQGKGSPAVAEVLKAGKFENLRISLVEDDLLKEQFYMIHVVDSSTTYTL